MELTSVPRQPPRSPFRPRLHPMENILKNGKGIAILSDDLLWFLDARPPKGQQLKKKLDSATSAIKSVFGQEESREDASDKLEKLRERMLKVRELFRDKDLTEFIIVTIPTVMAASESSRLRASLKKENVSVRRLIVNQVLPPSASDCKFCSIKRKDQMRALDMIHNDPELMDLKIIQAPLVDVEIRGVPALKFMGDMVWK